MQRWCSKLRSIAAALHSPPRSHLSLSPLPTRLLHSYSNSLHKPLSIPHFSSHFNPLFNSPPISQTPLSCHASLLPLSFIQVRNLTLKQRKRKLKIRRPPTPVVSKLKKIKMKSYSSYKDRFRTMNDGQIRRWKEGRRHNAHLKPQNAKRRLRLPGVVPAAYAKVMKKLNFSG